MNKYIENYVDKTKIKDKAYNSTLNINENTYSLINNNDDDNIQIINFLSEVINTEILKKKIIQIFPIIIIIQQIIFIIAILTIKISQEIS